MSFQALFQPSPSESCKILFTLSLLAVSLIILFTVNNFWLQLLNAIYLGFVSTQIGLLGHDIGHQQVFRSGWKSTVAGFLVGNLLVGWSWRWIVLLLSARKGN